MTPPPEFSALPMSVKLAHCVEAFEAVLGNDPDADFARHLPDPGHPLYLAALAELIRVDLEHAWDRGRRKRVADYAPRFPAVMENPTVLAAVLFEEYRQRLRAGESPRLFEYRDTYGVDTTGWLTPEEAGRTSVVPGGAVPAEFARTDVIAGREPRPEGTPPPVDWVTPPPRRNPPRDYSDSDLLSRWGEAAESLPEVGTEFLGFKLVEELGRGAFGRVYLAHQGDLAGRPVALKVACDIVAESNTLAQLQQTNIVPIYSFHRAGPFQAVCMPYFGRTTLAHVVQHISHRAHVPSSGKELRSTLDRGKSSAAPVSGSGSGSGPAPGSVASRPGLTDAPSTVRPGLPPAPEPAPEGWTRLDGLPYVDAVLALVGQLADGLAHAHRRGILHRDLKPANVLLTDDGRPMLLDFNLAEDTKARGSAGRAMVGGTLPYMAPEHMAAFRDATGGLDERCDIYSLGMILYELLTGRHPFPIRKGHPRDVVPLLIEDRNKPLPALRERNPAVSPGVESIVRKCLAPRPDDRYMRAEDLREDIDRHLANRPLRFARDVSVRERARKWARRHPRVASSGFVAAVAALLLVGLGSAAVYARERTRDLEARGRLADHQTAFRETQSFLDDRTRSRSRLDESLERLRGVLARYGVPDDPAASDGWLGAPALRYLSEADRERVKGDVGETFYLMAQVAYLKGTASDDPAERAAQSDRAARWNALAARYGGERLPRAVREQGAAIAELRGNREEAERLRAEAAGVPLASARDLYLAGTQLTRQGRHRDALKHLQKATQLDPENFSAWFVRGTAHLALEQDEQAAACFSACVSLRPGFAPAWLNRAFACFRMAAGRRELLDSARDDYDRALALDPSLAEAYIQRAELREATGDYKGAVEDYTRALETGTAPARAYFKRATAKRLLRDEAGAKADREAGLKVTPADELSWVARAEHRLADDPKGALADAEEALKLNPWSVFALQLKAHILAERLGKSGEAVAVLNRAVELHPDFAPARAGRGVLLARAGQRDAALRDAKDALRCDTRAPNLYQVGCIYALSARDNADDRREALRLLWSGLKTGFGLDFVDADHDLDALRDDPAFRAMVKDARTLQRARK